MHLENTLTSSHFESQAGLVSWLPYLIGEFSRPYIFHLRNFLYLEGNASAALEEKNRAVYPDAEKVFAALEMTPLCNVKAVIVGQAPYHHKDQADGLAFSMQKPVLFGNSSLRKIFELVNKELDLEIPLNGSKHKLDAWAERGVLLLNSVLSVRHGCPKSHYCQGWEKLTDKIVEVVSQNQENVVFFLWGRKAKCKKAMIDCGRGHKILCAPHPAAHREADRQQFQNSQHFIEAKCHFESQGLPSIDWRL